MTGRAWGGVAAASAVRRRLLAVFIILLCLGAPPLVVAEQQAGVVLAVRGEVIATREESVRSLERRDSLHVGDVIATGSGARAQFRMADGETITLHESTELVIEAFAYDASSGEGESRKGLLEGGLRAVSGALSRGSEVETPVATIGVRGTTYLVAHDPAEGTAVGVAEGVVNLANAAGSDSRDLGRGQDYPYGRVRNPDAPVEGLLEAPGLLAALDIDRAEEGEPEEGEEESDTLEDGAPVMEGEDDPGADDDAFEDATPVDWGAVEDPRHDLDTELDEDITDSDAPTETGRVALLAGPSGAGGALYEEWRSLDGAEIVTEFRDPRGGEVYLEGEAGAAASIDETVGWGYWSDARVEADGEVTEVDGSLYWMAAEPMGQAEIDALETPIDFDTYAEDHELHGMARTTAAGHFDLEAGVGGVELLFDPQQAGVSGRIDLFQEHDDFTETWWAEFSGDLAGAHTHFSDLDGGFTYLAADGGGQELSDLAADSYVDLLLITEDTAGGGFHLITADRIEELNDEFQEAIGVFVIERKR